MDASTTVKGSKMGKIFVLYGEKDCGKSESIKEEVGYGTN
jgi:hypothetical protein